MKKLIPVVLAMMMTACNAPNFSANGNEPDPKAAPTPVAPEVALQVSNSVANGARTVGGGVANSLALAKMVSVLDGRIFNGDATYDVHEITEEEVNEVKASAKDVLLTLFQNQTPLADATGWVQTTPSAEFCTKIHAENEDLQGCLEMIQHLIFRVSLTGPHSGEVIVFFNQQKLATLDFLPDGMSVEVHLATLSQVAMTVKSVWANLGVTIELPDFTSVQGKVQAMITKAKNLFHLSVAVTDAVSIVGTDGEKEINLNLPSSTGVNLEYNRVAQQVSVGLQIGKINLLVGTTNIKVGHHLSGKVIFDDQLNQVRTENLNFDNLEVIDGEKFTRVYIAPLNSTLQFHNDGVTLTHTSYLSVFVTIPEGTTSWGAYQDGSLIFRGNHPPQHTGTAIGMFNTGSFGNGSFTVPAGSCFRTTPLEIVDCEI